MSPIEKIIIPCYGPDLWLLRICVASIRYWYPDIPIGLLKDYGNFDTSELEKYFGVHLVAEATAPQGFWNKLSALYGPGRQRILLLDSDTVFLGPVLAKLETRDEDFVVEWERAGPLSETEKVRYALDGYFDLPALRRAFPDYEAPDYFFNAGQIVLTTGLLQPTDFAPFLTETNPPQLRQPRLFKRYDQSLLNFVLAEKKRQGLCSVHQEHFVVWGTSEIAFTLSLEQMVRRQGYPMLFHWATAKPYFKAAFRRGDILHFYENYYYSRIPLGEGKRWYRFWRRHCARQTPQLRRIWKMKGQKVDFIKLMRAEKNPGPRENLEAGLTSCAPHPRS
jgi:lipopolysaccharide biosynthesis glycosyltransferase